MIYLASEIEGVSSLLSSFELSPFKQTLVWIQEHTDNKESGEMLSVSRQHSDFRNVEKVAV